jgi:hypothetical protein
MFLESNGRTIRINKILKEYTSTVNTTQQFIYLLENPLIIYNNKFTFVLIETIYRYSYLLNLELHKYVEQNDLDARTQYYLRNIT